MRMMITDKYEKKCLCELCIQGDTSRGYKYFIGEFTKEKCDDCGETEDVHEVIEELF